ncbi:MAG: PQQ-dependent dehydrogenase, methanol/ethanol family [Alphaproteobacteria bacterium]|nr:PQQ-dependent dehydrogenase, methanol/ethanol family [Alphaproteobacteria bacterium]
MKFSTRYAVAGLLAVSLIGGVSLVAGTSQAQPADTPTNPFAHDPAAVAAGQKIFNSTCTACHGVGATGGRGPALNTGSFAHGAGDYDIFQTIRSGVAGTQMPSFARLASDDVWKVVTYIKSLSGGEGGGEVLKGDPARGQALFFGAGGCTACHEMNGRGAPYASDLSDAGTKSAELIRNGVVHKLRRRFGPSPEFAKVTMKDGTSHDGFVTAQDSFAIALNVSGKFVTLNKKDVQSIDSRSAVPADNKLTDAQVDDVVAYLAGQKKRDLAEAAKITPAPVLTYARIRDAAAEPQNYPTYWGDYHGHHFSELTQIDKANVGKLQAKWAASLPGQSTLESIPVVVDGVMYVSGPPGDVYAFDAKTGLQLWHFHRKQDIVNPYQINPSNRGVAVLDGRVFFGTLDDNLIALDAHTGRELWEVRIADTMEGFTLTGAPLAVKDKIIMGSSGGEMGLRGFLDAYDPATGKRLWRFYTTPAPGEPNAGTWPGDTWKLGGGGTWLTGSFDPELNTLYWGIGNPAPSFNQYGRKGDNLYTDSVVALDPDTGKLKWYYQFTPNDSHDWDSEEDMVLADQMVDGKLKKLLLHTDRNGVFYALDRVTGQFQWAKPFVKTTWVKGWDKNGRPIVNHDTDATPEGKIVWPATGGTNFQAPSYDKDSYTLFLQTNEAQGWANSGPAVFERGKLYTARGSVAPPPGPPAKPAIKAIDTRNGDILWTTPVQVPSLSAGVMATRGGVVFVATSEGQFMALDSKTGKPLWNFRTGGRMTSSPMGYAVDGKQYVAIGAGNMLYSFALPD